MGGESAEEIISRVSLNVRCDQSMHIIAVIISERCCITRICMAAYELREHMLAYGTLAHIGITVGVRRGADT